MDGRRTTEKGAITKAHLEDIVLSWAKKNASIYKTTKTFMALSCGNEPE